MKQEQIKKQIEELQEMLKDMKQERIEASIKHSEHSDFMVEIDEDILLCSVTINDLTKQLITKKELNNG